MNRREREKNRLHLKKREANICFLSLKYLYIIIDLMTTTTRKLKIIYKNEYANFFFF